MNGPSFVSNRSPITEGPTYAYNAPRPAFDRLFDERADELGVKRVRVRAMVERVNGDGLQLSEETLTHAPWLRGRQPDLLVDPRVAAASLRAPWKFPPKSARAKT
jgi:hypothetical protein